MGSKPFDIILNVRTEVEEQPTTRDIDIKKLIFSKDYYSRMIEKISYPEQKSEIVSILNYIGENITVDKMSLMNQEKLIDFVINVGKEDFIKPGQIKIDLKMMKFIRVYSLVLRNIRNEEAERFFDQLTIRFLTDELISFEETLEIFLMIDEFYFRSKKNSKPSDNFINFLELVMMKKLTEALRDTNRLKILSTLFLYQEYISGVYLLNKLKHNSKTTDYLLKYFMSEDFKYLGDTSISMLFFMASTKPNFRKEILPEINFSSNKQSIMKFLSLSSEEFDALDQEQKLGYYIQGFLLKQFDLKHYYFINKIKVLYVMSIFQIEPLPQIEEAMDILFTKYNLSSLASLNHHVFILNSFVNYPKLDRTQRRTIMVIEDLLYRKDSTLITNVISLLLIVRRLINIGFIPKPEEIDKDSCKEDKTIMDFYNKLLDVFIFNKRRFALAMLTKSLHVLIFELKMLNEQSYKYHKIDLLIHTRYSSDMLNLKNYEIIMLMQIMNHFPIENHGNAYEIWGSCLHSLSKKLIGLEQKKDVVLELERAIEIFMSPNNKLLRNNAVVNRIIDLKLQFQEEISLAESTGDEFVVDGHRSDVSE